MSLDLCIPDLLANGDISQGQADEMGLLFGELKRNYRRQFGDQAAAAMASEETVKRLAFLASERKRKALLQVQAQRQAWLNMQKYGKGAGNVRVLNPARPDHLAKAAEALMVRSEYAPYRNVEYQWKSVRGQAHSTMSAVLQKHSRNIIGQVREKAELDNMVRELFNPGSTGSAAAREFAGAWEQTAEGLRRRFNAAGGDIGVMEKWGLPQSHDSLAVEAAGFEKWRDNTLPLLDRERMIDGRTGAAFSDEALELALRDVFETISSDGWTHRSPGGSGRASLANRGQDPRFLIFADGDAWMQYQGSFGGKASPFDSMMAHIDGMSRDIALMEILGPNPAQMIDWIGDAIEKQAALSGGRGSREAAFASRRRIDGFFKEISGANRRPANRKLALGFSTLRSFQVATKLGSATLSTTSDQATQILARRMNGIPAAKGIATQIKLLNPANNADRELAVRMGLVAEEASHMGSATARMTGEELTGEVSQRVAETVLRVSGLNAVTQGGRWAFGMDFLAHISHERGKSFDHIDEPFRNAFQRYGMGESHWDLLRNTELVDERGARWIMPDKIANQRLRDDVMRMIQSETDFAVPVPGVAVSSFINSNLAKGTLIGELGRSAFQFKSFPVTIGLMQFQRVMAQRGWNKANYAAQLLIMTTVMGALALQLKEIAKGRDPRPIYDPDDPAGTAAFWGAAFAQGGGAGIYGDFFRSSQSRFGGGVTDTLAGPAFQTADNVTNLLLRQPGKALMGEKTNFGGASMKLLRSELPGGSLWFSRLSFERTILDEMQRQIDPNYRKAWKRMEKYADDQGTEYFWAPGDGVDQARTPDLSNLTGQE